MLELAILGLLKEQELHGYELKKRLNETLGMASGVSFGSLYPALGRLERAGAVIGVGATPAAAGIPQTGSLGGELAASRVRPTNRGRSRKVYTLTARGEALFEELLAREESRSDDTRTFNLRLAFAGYLPADARIGMLERRRAHLLERLRRSGSRLRSGRDRVDGYLRSLVEHDREATEHDLSWIEHLLASERAGTDVAGPGPGSVVSLRSGPGSDSGPGSEGGSRSDGGLDRADPAPERPPALGGDRPGLDTPGRGIPSVDRPGLDTPSAAGLRRLIDRNTSPGPDPGADRLPLVVAGTTTPLPSRAGEEKENR